jgi:hypothetical protein
MTRPKRSPMAPPREWVELLQMHDLELNRVRMLWRRGAGRYRPMVAPSGPDFDEGELDGELAETHFDWHPRDRESVHERRDRVAQTVERLWNLALEWTATHGPTCDYKLLGWDQNDESLFESGCRCVLPDEFAEEEEDVDEEDDVPPSPRTTSAPPSREGFGNIRASWQHLDGLKDSFIERLTQDRNWSFDTAQQAMDVAPNLLTRASEILKDTITFQREEVAHLRDRSTGQTEIKARAFAEMERSRRTGMTMEFLRYAVEAGIAAGLPVANRLIEVLGNRSMQVFPEFKSAQQALAYLALTFTATQLEQLFPSKPRAAGSFTAILHDAAKMEFEREALGHVMPLLSIFRDKRFRDVATAEQQMAGNYAIGRMALFRMNEYDGPNSTSD